MKFAIAIVILAQSIQDSTPEPFSNLLAGIKSQFQKARLSPNHESLFGSIMECDPLLDDQDDHVVLTCRSGYECVEDEDSILGGYCMRMIMNNMATRKLQQSSSPTATPVMAPDPVTDAPTIGFVETPTPTTSASDSMIPSAKPVTAPAPVTVAPAVAPGPPSPVTTTTSGPPVGSSTTAAPAPTSDSKSMLSAGTFVWMTSALTTTITVVMSFK